MRHIPDEELHAYLDQALSRNQCVEIECHLAECPSCRDLRDEIASLRDRTTALLGLLGPGRTPVAPPLGTLLARPLPPARSRWKVYGAYAAALVGAVLIGFAGHSVLDRQAAAPLATLSPEPDHLASGRESIPVPSPEPSGSPGLDPAELPVAPTAVPSRAVQHTESPQEQPAPTTVRTLDIRSFGTDAEAELDLDGLWKTVPWEEAEALTENLVPRIAGLPVVEVRVQQRSPAERPLIIVTQQASGGRLVRTIEGPVDEVAGLISEQVSRTGTVWSTSEPARTRPEYLPSADGSPRRSIRVAAVLGRMPVDSLNALRDRLTLR